jgi:hypothetical protein
MTEQEARVDERKKIAKCICELANNMLHDPQSDAIDGYVAAVLIELSETMDKF